jgi:hypothetical protein
MTEDERQKNIAALTVRLTALNNERDSLQSRLCLAITNIETTRQLLRDLGYQSSTATGA